MSPCVQGQRQKAEQRAAPRRRRATWTWALGAALGLSLVGCNRPTWSTPDRAYASVARAAQKGEYDTAWSGLSDASRKGLEERSKRLAAAAGGALEDDPRALFFASSPPPPPVGEIKVVRQEEAVALLAVAAEGAPPREVRMVKEAGGWKLDMSEALED